MNTATNNPPLSIAGHLDSGVIPICAAHPADDFGAATAALLHHMSGRPVVCVNVPRPANPQAAFIAIVDQLEAVRLRLGLGRWVFWGMSGGGWIGQQYAARQPGAVAALILESSCACFRARLADPACVLSPLHPAWRPALEQQALIDPDAHAQAGDVAATEWTDVPGVGAVFRRRGGPALLVSPGPLPEPMRAAMPALWCFDARPWLRDVRCPTLVLSGTADPVVPLPHAQALHRSIAGAQLAVIEGGGHVPSAQGNAEAIAAVQAFLRW